MDTLRHANWQHQSIEGKLTLNSMKIYYYYYYSLPCQLAAKIHRTHTVNTTTQKLYRNTKWKTGQNTLQSLKLFYNGQNHASSVSTTGFHYLLQVLLLLASAPKTATVSGSLLHKLLPTCGSLINGLMHIRCHDLHWLDRSVTASNIPTVHQHPLVPTWHGTTVLVWPLYTSRKGTGTSHGHLHTPRFRLTTFEGRSFASAVPPTWNSTRCMQRHRLIIEFFSETAQNRSAYSTLARRVH